MPIDAKEARQLCTKPEWDLIAYTIPPQINTLTPARLKPKIVRARKLRQKYTDLARRQHLSSHPRRKGTPGEQMNARTRRKAQLFTEAVRRLEARLKQAEADKRKQEKAAAKKAAKPKAVASKKRSVNVEASRQGLRREMQSRKKTSNSAAGAAKNQTIRKAGKLRIQGHAKARTQRRQATRDSRKR